MKATVKLNHITPLVVCSDAIRQCHQSQDKSDTGYFEIDYTSDDVVDFHLDGRRKSIGEKDKALISRVGVKMKHESTLEHIIVSFNISDISRALLQEFSRHRMMSQTVKSSRYTLGSLKAEKPFTISNTVNNIIVEDEAWNRARNYLCLFDTEESSEVDYYSVLALENLRKLIHSGVSNDMAKYCLPDSLKTSLTCTINFRSLRNMVSLRSHKSALLEFRKLIDEMLHAIPKEYMFLLEDCVYEE
jgi:thymidylate synthase (FAD)